MSSTPSVNGSEITIFPATSTSALFAHVERRVENATCFSFDNSPPAIAAQLLMAFVIIALNFMVVAIIGTSPKKVYKKPAFILIIALACTDMILALCLVCFSAVSIGDFQFSASKWVLLTATTSICFNASVNFLLVIALDRLCFICYNRRYHKIMTKRKLGFLIILCWTVGLVPVLPLLVGNIGSCAHLCLCSRDEHMTCPDRSCSTVYSGFSKSFLFGLFFYFLFMFLSISIVYTMLFWKVRRHSNRVSSHSGEQSSRLRSSRMRREFKLARTLGIVVIAFFLCWSPLMVLYVIDYASSDNFTVSKTVALALSSPAIFNSMLNPIIYAARIPVIRKRLCSCFCKSYDPHSETSASRRKTGRKSHGKKSTKVSGVESRNRSASYTGKDRRPTASTRESKSSFSSHFSSATENVPVESENNHGFTFHLFHAIGGIIQRFSRNHSNIPPAEEPETELITKPSVNARENKEVNQEFLPLNADISLVDIDRNSVIKVE